MPSLAFITNTFFVNLINRLGVRPPPPQGFELSNVVQPVSIVDADISIPNVLTTSLLDTGSFTQGVLAGPNAGDLIADTGPQVAGNYLAHIFVGNVLDLVTNTGMILARRNAANNADVWSQLITTGGNVPTVFLTMRFVLLVNERLRLTLKNTSGVGSSYQGQIWLFPN
jgi:hypothetical protein